MIVNIQDDILKINSLGLLEALLADKTTNNSIMWATDSFDVLGEKYARNQQISVKAITGNIDIIKTRARKELENKSARTKQHAEVFTPLKIVNLMNNYADEEWFGKKDVFNKEGIPSKRVVFPKDKSWKEYISSNRLEITCGEAPFLVTRYDADTGESIPVNERVGILDRKLRVLRENVTAEEDWLDGALKCLQSTYGYEFQGDNLLIARVNLLMTLEEYSEEVLKRKPTLDEYKAYIKIIVWNIWQMDGLTGTVPYHKRQAEFKMMSLFEEDNITDEIYQPVCKIYDWQANKSVELNSLRK